MEKEMKRYINIALKKDLDSDITNEDLLNVKELTVSNLDLSCNVLNLDLSILEKMPNLEELSLMNFALSSNLLYNIKVKKLILFNCNVSFENEMKNVYLKDLKVINTYLASQFLNSLVSLENLTCSMCDIETGKLSLNDVNNLANKVKINVK